MASGRNELGWRDRAAADLLLRHLPTLTGPGPILVVGDPLPDVSLELESRGLEVEPWHRRALAGRLAAPWPPDGPFSVAALRLSRSKAELEMSLAALAGVLPPGALLLVYGAKDEGVGSAPRLLEGLFEDVGTMGVGGRCRVLRGVRTGRPPEKSTLADWKEIHSLKVPALPESWITYPGVFSQGHLDPGTALLLDALPSLDDATRILDYGCGSGIVGAFALQRSPGAEIHFLDVDAVALEAARENVPGGVFLLRDGLPADGGVRYDAVLTNPPFHRGKAEDVEMIPSLIRHCPLILTREGRLVLVAQKRLALEPVLMQIFREVSCLADASGFRVLEGRYPKVSEGPG